MATTLLRNWVYPGEIEPNSYGLFERLVQNIEQDVESNSEDSRAILVWDSDASWTYGNNTLVLSNICYVINPNNGGRLIINPVTLTGITSGSVVYVDAKRPIEGDLVVTLKVGTSVGNDLSKMPIAVRVGNVLFYCNGTSSDDHGGGGGERVYRQVVEVLQGLTPEEGGNNLRIAYETAKGMASVGNRVELFIPAGNYLLTETFYLDSDYVDLKGDGIARAKAKAYTEFDDRYEYLNPLTIIEGEFSGELIVDQRTEGTVQNIFFDLRPESPSLSVDSVYSFSTNGDLTRFANCRFGSSPDVASFICSGGYERINSLFYQCHGVKYFIANRAGRIDFGGACIDCTAHSKSFVYGTGNVGTDSVVYFKDCFSGEKSFGYTLGTNITLYGIFFRCSSGGSSFGSGPAATVELAPTCGFIECSSSGDLNGEKSFGYTYHGYFEIQATFEKCRSGDKSFGCSEWWSTEDHLYGFFTDCIGGDKCFGSTDFNTLKMKSVIKRCQAGDMSFGFSLSRNGVIFNVNSKIEDCSGKDYCFGSNTATSGTTAVMAGSFKNCDAHHYSFGYSMDCSINFDYSAIFEKCSSLENSFGCCESTNSALFVQVWSSFYDCVAGNKSFGYCNTGIVAFAAMTNFTNCKAGNYSLGCSDADNHLLAVLIGGVFNKCTSGHHCFGSSTNTVSMAFVANFYDCVAGNNSFGYVHSNGGLPSNQYADINIQRAIFHRCVSGSNSFLSNEGDDTSFSCKNVEAIDCTAGPYSFICSINGDLSVGKAESGIEYIRFMRCRSVNCSFVFAGTGVTNIVKDYLDTVIFDDCIGANACFFHSEAGDVTVINTTFKNCIAVNNSFVSGSAVVDCTDTDFINCSCIDNCFIWSDTPDTSAATGITIVNCITGQNALLGVGGTITGRISDSIFGNNALRNPVSCIVKGCTFGTGSITKVITSSFEDTDLGKDFTSYVDLIYTGSTDIDSKFLRCKSIGRTVSMMDLAGYFEGCQFQMPVTDLSPLISLTTRDSQPTIYDCTLISGTFEDPGPIFGKGSGSFYFVGVAHCRMSTDDFDSITNVYGDTATAQNVVGQVVRISGMAVAEPEV